MAEHEIKTFDERQYYPPQFSRAYGYDEVYLVSRYSAVVPANVNTRTRLTRLHEMERPFIAAAMDTVTERATAKVMAQLGGFAVLHNNFPTIEQQIAEVEAVKRSEGDVILKPEVAHPEQSISNLLDMLEARGVSGAPVTIDGEPHSKLIGMITARNLRDVDPLKTVADYMTSENLVTAPEGTTLEQAKGVFAKHPIEKLPIVDEEYNLRGLLTYKDIQKQRSYPNATKDKFGRLMVGAAIGVTGDYLDQARALVGAGVDVLNPDSSHAHSENVLLAITALKEEFGDEVGVIGGNVVTYAGALAVINAGADAVKFGIGGGATCITSPMSGVGLGQITAIMESSRACVEHDIPGIADGGIKLSGDVTKAIGARADSVMIGMMFGGTNEAPGEIIKIGDEYFKALRGMGSVGAMEGKGGQQRYKLMSARKKAPEGLEGFVPHKGPLADTLEMLLGGLQSGMGQVGARNIRELQERAIFMEHSPSAQKERHAHDMVITQQAPNYRT